ncbi:MAG: thiamine phosphate synthase [Polyangiales bacterium]
MSALWLCADLDHPRAEELPARVTAALGAGPATVWLRSAHGTPACDLVHVAHQLRAITRASGAALYIGDRVDVALVCRADGVHLPERSFAPAQVAGLSLRRSRAVHDPSGVAAHAPDCDAVIASPFGPVPGKGAPLGVEGLRTLVRAAGGTPLIALGGVRDGADARACRLAGARGVAVRRALMDADDPAAACARLWEALEG